MERIDHMSLIGSVARAIDDLPLAARRALVTGPERLRQHAECELAALIALRLRPAPHFEDEQLDLPIDRAWG